MVKLICLVILSLLGWTEILHAELATKLSRTNIDELESVQLTIRVSGTRSVEELDLSELEASFQITNTNTSSQYQYINGNEQSWVDYQITLKPKMPGELVVPSLKIGDQRSAPISLTVRPISQSLRNEINELVFFEVETSKNRIYVQEQLVFTRRLVYSNGVQLYNEIPGSPQIDNALVLTLGETKSGTAQRNGKKYGIVEQTFAIFPEKSGILEIPPINITASVRLIERGRVTRKGVRVGTPKINIDVNPVPAEYPKNQPWLPAHAVILSQIFSPEKTNQLNVGDSIERRLQVRIDGNTGSILPSLSSQLPKDFFREYPLNPTLEDDTSGNSVTGFRNEISTIVPLQPGNFPVGQEQITWWDTISDEVRISKLDYTRLSVAGLPIYIENQIKEKPVVSEDKEAISSSEPEEQTIESLSEKLIYWRETLAVTFSLLLLCFSYVFFRNIIKPDETAKKLRSLLSAAHTGNAKIIKKALQDIQINRTDQASVLIENEIIRTLNAYLYQAQPTTPLSDKDQNRVSELAKQLKQIRTTSQKKERYALPPLYDY